MPTIEELKAKVQAEIDRRGEDIVRVAQIILLPTPVFVMVNPRCAAHASS